MKSADDDGFTFMEALASIGITLVLSAALCFLFVTLLSNGQKGNNRVLQAVRLAQTDTFIRGKAAQTVIPYWERGTDASAVFTAELFSENGLKNATVVSVENLYDAKKRIRGVAVNYKITGCPDVFHTNALFGSIPVVGAE